MWGTSTIQKAYPAVTPHVRPLLSLPSLYCPSPLTYTFDNCVTFPKEMWKERCLFIPNGVQWAKESFLLSLFGKPVRLLGLNDKVWRRCHSQEGNSWAAPSLTNPSYHGSWLLTVASLEPSSSACRQLLCRVSSPHPLLAQPHRRVSWVL